MDTTLEATFEHEILEYASSFDVARANDMLANSMAGGVWIYGAGGYGRRIGDVVLNSGLSILGFIDRSADRLNARGDLPAPCVAPSDISVPEVAGKVLLVGVQNTNVSPRDILVWATPFGFSDIVSPVRLVQYFGHDASSYWLDAQPWSVGRLNRAAQARALLSDEHSKKLYSDLLKFRVSGDILVHPNGDVETQYFPSDLPLPRTFDCFIDGGAFVGDSMQSAIKRGYGIKNWIAFEPDQSNFSALCTYAATLDKTRATLLPCGLGSTSEQVGFFEGTGASSHAVAEGQFATTFTQIVALDDIMPQMVCDYVKLDIEGFEAAALEGMRKLFARNKPILALSIYHKPDDLWELIELASELCPYAKLYIRQHGHNAFDTVLYAIPA
jgi:FkbM family methyltransferase